MRPGPKASTWPVQGPPLSPPFWVLFPQAALAFSGLSGCSCPGVAVGLRGLCEKRGELPGLDSPAACGETVVEQVSILVDTGAH